jgi:hypothetical protein
MLQATHKIRQGQPNLDDVLRHSSLFARQSETNIVKPRAKLENGLFGAILRIFPQSNSASA